MFTLCSDAMRSCVPCDRDQIENRDELLPNGCEACQILEQLAASTSEPSRESKKRRNEESDDNGGKKTRRDDRSKDV